MSLHLIKLSVGCSSSEELASWIKQRMKQRKARGEKPEHIHTTRMAPKRAEELLDGGSLYWVIKGQIAAREKLRDIRPFTDKDGISRCRLVMEPKLVLVEPRPFPRLPGAGVISTPRMHHAISTVSRRARKHARTDAAGAAGIGLTLIQIVAVPIIILGM